MLKLFQIQPGCTTLYNLVVYRGNIMISIKDYAKNNNVSYEAIRRRIKRNEEVFKGHIVKKNRTQFLDDVAVEILDNHKKNNSIVIVNQSVDERIRQLEEENKNLLVKVASQADKIAELSEWKANNALLISQTKVNQIMLEEKNCQISDLLEENKQLKDKLEKEKSKSLLDKLLGR